MKLTIAIPTFNRAADLNNLLSSIYFQLKDPRYLYLVDVLIIDNCSEDETSTICDKFSGLCGAFKCIKNEKNLGLTRNMYECLFNSKAEYVWMIGDDETIEESAIDKVLEQIDKFGKDIYIFNYSSEPNPQGVNFLQSNYGRSLENIEGSLRKLVMNYGWLWCLGNLGMVVARRSYLDRMDFESYSNCNFGQSAWYLEAFIEAEAKFVNVPIFRTYIRSQTINKDRWKTDGTSSRFISLKNTVYTLIEKKIIPSKLPLEFFNGCSAEKFPFWGYLLTQIQDSIKLNNLNIESTYWHSILDLLYLVEDEKLRQSLINALLSIMVDIVQANSFQKNYLIEFNKFINTWNDSFNVLQFSIRS